MKKDACQQTYGHFQFWWKQNKNKADANKKHKEWSSHVWWSKQKNNAKQNNSKRYPPTLPIFRLSIAFSLPHSCISSLSATSKQNNRCFSSQIKNCHQQTIQNAFFPPCERNTTANKTTSLENNVRNKTKNATNANKRHPKSGRT